MSPRRLIAVAGALLVLGPAAAWAQPAPAPAEPRPPVPPADVERLQKLSEAQQADLEEQGARIRELEKQVKALLAKQKEGEKGAAPAPAPAAPAPAAPPSRLDAVLPEIFRDLSFSGYLQAQYESHQDAQD